MTKKCQFCTFSKYKNTFCTFSQKARVGGDTSGVTGGVTGGVNSGVIKNVIFVKNRHFRQKPALNTGLFGLKSVVSLVVSLVVSIVVHKLVHKRVRKRFIFKKISFQTLSKSRGF